MPREKIGVIDKEGNILSEEIVETDRHPDYKLLSKVVANIYREEQKENDKVSA